MPAPPDPARWPAVKRLFERALALAPEARPGFLDAACRTADGAPDPELRATVARLLDADADAPTEQTGAFLAAKTVSLGSLLEGLGVDQVAEAEPGTRVGPYRVVRLLGRGGMGEVYLAERADGLFERTVALKRVRADLAPSVAARFSTERQILADLGHRGIARLFDAGADADGRPWLALEHVDGVPITEAAGALSVAARLALMADVAEAVHHAHRRLVVHRDLKPSNVLVTEADDGRQVKLLDFGIAQILDAEADEAPDGPPERRPMTRAYAAPEQLRGGDVTTATDVHGLGLLLYEVLTGARPFPDGRSADAPEPPPRLADAPSGAAGPADAEPADLGPWRRDLDAICGRALAAEPEARYASAEALAADLRRVLAHRPVAARAPSAAYRSGRFVRRHRLGVAATVAALVALVGSGAFYTVRLAAERDRAEQAAAEADRTADFLESLFADADPTGAAPGDRTARELLLTGDARVRDELADEPGVLAGLLATIGRVHRTMGRFEAADSALVDALALYERTANDPIGHRDALLQLANLRFRTESYGEAARFARAALRLDSLHARGDASERLGILNTMGLIHQETGDNERARELLTEVVAGRRLERGEEAGVDLASNLSNLGVVLLELGRPEEALPLFDESVALVERHRGSEHPYLAFALHARAGVHEDLADLGRAEDDERRALAIGEATLGPDHPFTEMLREDLLPRLVARRDSLNA